MWWKTCQRVTGKHTETVSGLKLLLCLQRKTDGGHSHLLPFLSFFPMVCIDYLIFMNLQFFPSKRNLSKLNGLLSYAFNLISSIKKNSYSVRTLPLLYLRSPLQPWEGGTRRVFSRLLPMHILVSFSRGSNALSVYSHRHLLLSPTFPSPRSRSWGGQVW